MATDRKQVGYRADDEELALLSKLSKKRGLPITRLIGTAIREMAQRDNVSVTEEEIEAAKQSKK